MSVTHAPTRLQLIRLMKGQAQVALARECGLTQTEISDAERFGRCSPRVLARLATALGATREPEKLLERTLDAESVKEEYLPTSENEHDVPHAPDLAARIRVSRLLAEANEATTKKQPEDPTAHLRSAMVKAQRRHLLR